MKKLGLLVAVLASAAFLSSCANHDMTEGTCLNPAQAAPAPAPAPEAAPVVIHHHHHDMKGERDYKGESRN